MAFASSLLIARSLITSHLNLQLVLKRNFTTASRESTRHKPVASPQAAR